MDSGMTSRAAQIQGLSRAGMCPHGLPSGACPVCSGRGGAASGSSAKLSRPKEWSYQKCYAAGLEIKAAAARRADAASFAQKHMFSALEAEKNIQNILNKFNSFVLNIKTPALQSAAVFFMNAAVNPVFNSSAKFAKFTASAADFTRKALDMLQQAGEKFTAVLGEIKNFVQRNIIENLKKKAKKFMLFCLSGIEDENYKNDDTLAVFKSRELKKYIVKILKKYKDNEH